MTLLSEETQRKINEVLSYLQQDLPDADAGILADEPEAIEAPVASPTAIKMDSFSHKRGGRFAGSEEYFSQFGDNSNDVAADFFSAAWEPSHELNEACQDEARHGFISSLLESPEFQKLHRLTKLDQVASEIAAVGFAKQFVAFAAEQSKDDELEESARANGHANKAVNEVKDEIEQVKELGHALGIGDQSEGEDSIDFSSIRFASQQAKRSDMLRQIMELSGRYRRLAQSMQRNKKVQGLDETAGVEFGDDVSRILPSELIYLSDPELEDIFYQRLANKSLRLHHKQSTESVSQGPVVIVIDESASMGADSDSTTTGPIHQAKAMALAMLWIARQQERWAMLVGFSGKGDSGSYYMERPGHDKGALISWLEHFYRKGTSAHVLMNDLPKKWESLGCPEGQTDIILITDGLLRFSDETRKSFEQFKQDKQVELKSIVIGSEIGPIKDVSDSSWTINELDVNASGISEALSI